MSFWLPGQFGSLAAVPQAPGFSMANVYYHTSVSAGADKAFPIGGGVQAGLKANADLGLFIPSYVFASPVFGGQFAVSMATIIGRNNASAAATLSGPNGNQISGYRSDSVGGFGDLYPMATLRWNQGVNNWMVYMTGDLPVGAYNINRLANLGIGHWAIDGGAGYTYFNPQTGHEFSAVTGLTYNFKNPANDYQNGIDWHLDWGASQFLSKQLFVGAVGYVYQQLTGDSGSGARLGPFKSRVLSIGPQIGYIIPMGDHQGYLNLKGYKEFDAENRPSGYNVWLTFAVSPTMPGAPPPTRALITK